MATQYVTLQATYVDSDDNGANAQPGNHLDNGQMVHHQHQMVDNGQNHHHQMAVNYHQNPHPQPMENGSQYYQHGGNQHHDHVEHLKMSTIPKDELMNEFIHPSIFTDGGVLVNFLNHNCPDSATVIGGIRMKTREIERVPLLLSQYYSAIKTHAAYALQKHMVRSQSALGLSEVITVDDFSLTFMLGSISQEALDSHPYSRKEGPLHYCYFPNLVKQMTLGYTQEGKPDTCYLINAYVHLLDESKRRNAVIKKKNKRKQEEEPKTQQPAPGPSANKKPKFQKKPFQQPPELASVKDSISRIEKQVMKLNLPGQPAYPQLPESPAAVWPSVDASPPWPENL